MEKKQIKVYLGQFDHKRLNVICAKANLTHEKVLLMGIERAEKMEEVK